MTKKRNLYPTKTKEIKATTWGKNLSKGSVRSFKKLGKYGNKARKR